MFYDAHFTIDVTNWLRGIWLDGTTQIMDREDILLSDHLVPAYLLDVDPFMGEGVSKRPIWDHFVDDLTNDPVIDHSRTPVEAATQWRPAKPLTHSTRFHVYTKSMGKMTFISGEVALTVDNVETLSWETNVGMTCSEDIAGKVQVMFDRLVVGALVMDSLTSVANACGITFAMMGDFLIVAYFGGEIIGQIAVGVSRGGVELAPSCLYSPDRSDAVEEAWSWFCGRIREIPDSVTV